VFTITAVLLADIAYEVSTHPACPGPPDDFKQAILDGVKIPQDSDGALRNAVIGLCQGQRPRLRPNEIDEVLGTVFVDGGKKLT